MEENKTILTDYFCARGEFFIPIVEDELFFSMHSDDVYTAYLKMRMDKIYQKKKLDEIDGFIMKGYIHWKRNQCQCQLEPMWQK